MSLAKLQEHPSGIDLGPLQPQLPDRLLSKDKIIRCDAPAPLADLSRLHQEFSQPHNGLLKLIGRRHVRSNNSWMHNYRRLVKGKGRCTLLMHPQDMAHRDIDDGADVTISSRSGAVQVRVEACQDMMPGVVSLPHGYGHTREGTRMKIAAEHAGASINDLTDPAEVDPLSGTAVLSGVPVEIAPLVSGS